jgi:tetratricopeptide (TPR) repeat protein/glycosyltransferase involved in cell wall biosynthesis
VQNNLGNALKEIGQWEEAIAAYQQALRFKPNYPEAHHNLGSVLRDQGKLAEAVQHYREALVLKPNYAEALHNLGVTLRFQGKFAEAIAQFQQSLALNPNYPEVYNSWGYLLQLQGETEHSLAKYQQALALKPNYPEVYNNLGNLLQSQGKFADAIAHYRQAIVLKAAYPEAYNNLGNALQEQGNLEPAIAAYQQALLLRPDYPEAYNNLGNGLQEQGKVEEAKTHYQRALELRPNFPEAHSNLGAVLKDQKKLDEAIAHFQQALAMRPDYAEVHNNLGNAYQDQRNSQAAMASYRQALALNPNLAESHSNLGNLLQQEGQFTEAVAHIRQAIALQPDFAGAYNNLGIALRNSGQIAAAEEAYRQAIALKPDFVEAHWNIALNDLLLGKLPEGFARYEWRFQWNKFQEQNLTRSYVQPRWDGSPLNGKTLFLYAEQGMGDTIQFVRYAAIAAEQGSTIILECHPPLVNLLHHVPGIQQVIPYGSPPPAFDVHAPLMSLPHILGTALETIPNQVPYIVKTRLIASLQDGERGAWKLGECEPEHPTPNTPHKIGLVWSGNPENPYNRSRACPLAQLLTLAEIPGVTLYSLQKDVPPPDLELLQVYPQVHDLRQHLQDFTNTAAIITQLDLVISVDTAVAHLAGALGKAVWLLLPFAPDWRWLTEREDSPWYPTMRLFRQPGYGDWDSVLEQVQEALREKAAGEEMRRGEDRKEEKKGKSERQRAKPRTSNLEPPTSNFKLQTSPSSPSPPPPLPPPELKLAIQYHRAGQVRQAEEVCRQLVQRQPDCLDGWQLLGLIAHQDQRRDEAIAHYRKVLSLNPEHHDTYNNIAVAFHEQGRIDEAIPYYERVLALKPDYVDAHNNYANALRDKNRIEEAIQHYRRAIALRPNYADAHNNLGLALYAQGDYAQAAEHYRQAVTLRPNFAQAHNHLGNALKELGRFDEAVVHYQQAIALKPDYAKAFNNWGNIFRDSGDLQTAIAYYNRAVAIDPDFAEAHWNKALTLLLGGDLAQGFAEYEWRWRVKLPTFAAMRPFSRPCWDGSPLNGKTILLHAEQGMGDIIQFIRYAPLVASMGGDVIAECHPPLLNLLKHVSGIRQLVPYGSNPPDFDVHAPLMSLPHILGVSLDNIPNQVPYLSGERGKQGTWKLGDSKPEHPAPHTPHPTPHTPHPTLNIGLVWSGNPENPYNRSRSCPLAQLLTLEEIPGVTLYSLQKDVETSDLELLQAHPKVQDLRHQLQDFTDTAVIITQLDLVISVDTAVTHLAGALGQLVWLLLPFAPDWRWMLQRDDSPWYPTLRLFRQTQAGDWAGVIERVKEALIRGEISTPPSPQPTASPSRTDAIHRVSPPALSPPSPISPTLPIPILVQAALQHCQNQSFKEAETVCRHILERQPDHVETLHILGVVYGRLGQRQEAIVHFQRVLELQPDFAEAWGNLGTVLQETGQLEDAIARYRQAIALKPDYVEAHQNLAVALQELYCFEEALIHNQRVVDLKPNFAEGYYNLGFLLRRLGRLEEAIAHYRHAIHFQPDFALAHKNLGHALLLQGNLLEGFAEYEWRWQQPNWAPRPFSQPRWDGSSLTGKTILLHAEQGFGDTIQFIRYTTLVKAQGAQVIVECQPELLRLLETANSIDRLIPQNSPLPPFDVHAPLLSLPHILGTALESIPGQVPYLGGERGRGEEEEMGKMGEMGVWKLGDSEPEHSVLRTPHPTPHTRFNIGIVWAGNPNHKNDHLRSCGLSAFLPLFDRPDVKFYSLQKGDAAAELRALPELPIQDLSESLQDFADTAAAIAQLDLMITIDTAVAHLAGALGKPVWLILCFAPDWRWMLERNDSPWYPTMRLFRQTRPSEWTDVFEQVRTALAETVKQSTVKQLTVNSEIVNSQQDEASPSSPSSSSSLPSSLPSGTDAINRVCTPLPFPWPINEITDAGIFGLHLALQLIQKRHWQAIPLDVRDLRQLHPLYRALLEPLIVQQSSSRLNSPDTLPLGVAGSDYETISGNLDTSFRIQRNHSAIQQRLPLLLLGNSGMFPPERLSSSPNQPRIGVVFAENLDREALAIAQSCDYLIALSTWSAEKLKRDGFSQVQTIAPGIAPNAFHPAAAGNWFGDRFVVFSGGELSDARAQDLVIAAFRAFHSRHPDALLLTAWYCSDPVGLNQLLKRGYIGTLPEIRSDGWLHTGKWLSDNGLPEESFVDLGAVPHSQMGQVLRSANVTLFPSRCQVSNNRLALESLACGIPTILSANTGHLDLLHHNLGYPLHAQQPITGNLPLDGWGESSVDEIVETLERIDRDRQEAKYRSIAAADFVRNWTWENQLRSLINLLNR